MSQRIKIRNIVAIALLGFSAVLLQGCGNKVDCNSSKAKADAIAVIQSHLVTVPWYQEIGPALTGDPELTGIQTTSRNDETKQYSCSAKYTVTYNSKPREIDVAYYLAYLEDKKEVEVKVAVNDVIGSFANIVMREAPIKNGTQKIMDPKTGNLQHSIEWKNGVQDGVEEIYNPVTNKLIGEIHVSKGQKAGSEKRWNQDGTVLLIDLDWADGKPTGFQKQYNAAGDKLITNLTFKDGLASGIQTTGDLGSNYDEYEWKDGQYDGVHKSYRWDAGGTIHLDKVEHYKAGKLDGLQQDYNPDGTVGFTRNYKDGVEVPVESSAANTVPTNPSAQ